MVQGTIHHLHRSPHKHKGLAKIFDRAMYGIALVAPIMTLPQLYQVWILKQTQGVSLLTWGGYAVVSALWFVYGLSHNDKPLMLTQLLLLVLDAGIFLGVVVL